MRLQIQVRASAAEGSGDELCSTSACSGLEETQVAAGRETPRRNHCSSSAETGLIIAHVG